MLGWAAGPLVVGPSPSVKSLQMLRTAPCAPSMSLLPGESCTGEKVVVVGATGYIGKAVVREAVRRGYPTTAVVRNAAKSTSEAKFQGATVVQADVCDMSSSSVAGSPFEKGSVVVSCLASRSGSKKDSFAIDYQATLNCLNAARAAGARHFVLLSAFCVKSAERNDPYALQFQYAKKAMEGELRAQSDMTYTIVRPTAFFKSVSGQLEVVNGGAPFVYFDLGNGKSATCNPISEPDLAAALIDTIADPARENTLWNIGGPDDGLSMQEQGNLLADVLGKDEAKLLGVPIGLFDVIVDFLQGSADVCKGAADKLASFVAKEPSVEAETASTFFRAVAEKLQPLLESTSESLGDSAEFGRIGRYYAIEDMLTTEPADRYGKTTLREHYERIAKEGQEYDPYTSMFGAKEATESQKSPV